MPKLSCTKREKRLNITFRKEDTVYHKDGYIGNGQMLINLRRMRAYKIKFPESEVNQAYWDEQEFLYNGARLVIGYGEAPNIERLVKSQEEDARDACTTSEVEITPIEIVERDTGSVSVMFVCKGKAGLVDKKYLPLLLMGDRIVSRGTERPLIVLHCGDVLAVVMPMLFPMSGVNYKYYQGLKRMIG